MRYRCNGNNKSENNQNGNNKKSNNNKNNKRYLLLGSIAAFFAAIVAVPDAVSQDSGENRQTPRAGPIDEIVISVRRREESLQDVPISVTALTSGDIEQLGIQDSRDVAKFVPNVTMDNFGGRTNNTFIFIRGVGGGDGNASSLQAGVGIYIDGVYMPRSNGGYMSALDTERIEVLRGPQGTLFGKNTTGGAVNIVSKKPENDTYSNWTFRVGDYNQKDVRGTINLPLIEDKLFARFTALAETRDGYYTETLTGDDYSNRRRFAGRMAFRYLINDHFTFDISGSYANQPERPQGASCIWNGPGGLQGAVAGTDGTDFQAACNASSLKKREFTSDLDGFSKTEIWDINTHTTWDSLGPVGVFDNLEAKLIAAWRGQSQSFLEDSDWTYARMEARHRITPVEQEQRQFELQLNGEAMDNRLHFTTGFFWADDIAEESGNDCRDELASIDVGAGESVECINPGGFGFTLVPGAGIVELLAQIFAEIETSSIFANATFDLTDNLSITAGARQTWEDREFSRLDINNVDQSSVGRIATLSEDNIAFFNTGSDSWSELTPTVSINYLVSDWGPVDSGNFYFTYAKGFQSGGFNTEIAESILGDQFTYNPETVDSFEVGFKATWLDGRMQLNLAAFQADFDDRQVETVIDSGAFASVDPNTTLISNAATMSTDGIEMNMILQPVDAMVIRLSAGYLDASYDEFINFDPTSGTFVDQSDRRVDTRTPEWTAVTDIEYTFGLAGGSTLTPKIIGYYKGGYEWQTNTFEDDPETAVYQDAYTKWDARLNWNNASESTTVTAFVTNIFDEDTIKNGSLVNTASRGWTEIYLDPPRTSGVEVQLRF